MFLRASSRFIIFLHQLEKIGFVGCVTYWPSTEPSIKRCTCVNKRGNNRSRWTSNKNITRAQMAWVSWRYDASGVRTSSRQRAWALSDPRLSSPARIRKKCCYGQKNLGSICSSLSPSLTHLSHTTNINPSENKVWEVYFYKEACSFFHWSSSLCLIMFRIYLYYVHLLGFYGISTFIDYLMPNPLLYK